MIGTFIKKTAKKVLPQGLIQKAQILSGKKVRVYQPAEFSKAHLRLVPDAKPVPAPSLNQVVFRYFYDKKSPDTLVPGEDVGFHHSWVPFVKGKTKVLIYNFFNNNYGLRDPILFRFLILGAEGKVLSVKNTIIEPNGILFTSDFISTHVAPVNIPEFATLVVQAFHPRLPKLGRQLRFFVFMGESDESLTCGVHSQVVAPSGVSIYYGLGCRAFADSDKTTAFSFTEPHMKVSPASSERGGETIVPLTAGRKLKSPPYFVQTNNQGIPVSIWHDAPNEYTSPLAKNPEKTGSCKTAFTIPDFKRQAPFVLVYSKQVGFQPKEIQITAFDEEGVEIASEPVVIERDGTVLDLWKVFSGRKINGLVKIIFDFKKDIGEFQSTPICYLHLFYRNEGDLSDQGHSLSSFGFSNRPKDFRGGFRCRKFAPLFKNENYDLLYTVSNVGGIRPNEDNSIFVRVVTDKGIERRYQFPLQKEGVTSFTSGQFLKDLGGDMDQAGVILYEHGSTNFNGSWHLLNKKLGTVGMDHFTGG